MQSTENKQTIEVPITASPPLRKRPIKKRKIVNDDTRDNSSISRNTFSVGSECESPKNPEEVDQSVHEAKEEVKAEIEESKEIVRVNSDVSSPQS